MPALIPVPAPELKLAVAAGVAVEVEMVELVGGDAVMVEVVKCVATGVAGARTVENKLIGATSEMLGIDILSPPGQIRQPITSSATRGGT